MRAPTLAERGAFCILRTAYSLFIAVLVFLGFGYSLLMFIFIALYMMSFVLWDLLFSSRFV